MRRLIGKLHGNDRGAISVLTLLTIWCLIATIAMVWNTTEAAFRRQHLQAAADSLAQSSALWTSRAVNYAASSNMVICQDAATETIWRAVPIADTSIKNELNAELALANSMLKQNGLAKLHNQLVQQLGIAQNDHDLTLQQLDAIQSDLADANFATPQDATDFATQLRQAQSALAWVDQTYMNGAAPTAGRPGPPAPGGEGLAQFISTWNPPGDAETQVLTLVINYLNQVELPIIQGPDNAAPNGQSFETRTAPETSRPQDQLSETHEQTVFQSEQTMAQAVPGVVEQQRQSLAQFYNASLTLATPLNASGSSPAQIYAPILPADQISSDLGAGYTDGIRAQYPQEAAAAGLPVTFDVDAINPQTGIAEVWHPNIPITVPLLNKSYTVNCNVAGGWGHIWAMPIEQYLNDRVWNDQQTLNTTYMQYLDDARNNRPGNPRDLAYQIRQILSLPDYTNIASLPASIPDDQPDPKGVTENILVLPRLTAPAAAGAKFRTLVDLYNQHAAGYTADVRQLLTELQTYTAYFQRFTQSFAVNYWTNAVAQSRDLVMENLGTAKTFMVLATYKLRWVPQQLQGGLKASAQTVIQDQILTQNVNAVTQQIVNDLIQANPDGYGGAYLDKTSKHNALYAYYIGIASQDAVAAITPAAAKAADEISTEWVRRPWPYEITPPANPDLSPCGLGIDDRQQYFTILAGAEQTDASSPKFLLAKIFGTPPKIVTYAQSETFNWMEFNNSYGGSERFDQVSWITNYYPSGFGFGGGIKGGIVVGGQFGGIPVPRCWRLSTIGGWNWQPRLSLADALPQALQNNPELEQYLNDAGITGTDPADLSVVNLH